MKTLQEFSNKDFYIILISEKEPAGLSERYFISVANLLIQKKYNAEFLDLEKAKEYYDKELDEYYLSINFKK